MQQKNDPENLLGDLESIRQLLREEASDVQPTATTKIPILLETVASIIPTLNEIIDSPAADEFSVAKNTHESGITTPHPVTDLTEARLTAEGEQLIENLIEEYLPLIESRLREQLHLRLSFIIKEQLRKYR